MRFATTVSRERRHARRGGWPGRPRARRRWPRRSRAPPRAPPASVSTPRTGPQPSLAAAIASTPEPVPRSTSVPRAPPSSASSSSSSTHIRVVGWAPVPNACPGSTTTDDLRPSCAVVLLPGRPDRRRGRRSRTGSWKSRQRSAQSSGISSRGDLDRLVAGQRPRPTPGRGPRPVRRRSRTRPSRARPPPRPRRAPAPGARRAPPRRPSGRSGPRGGSTPGAAPAPAPAAAAVALLGATRCSSASVSSRPLGELALVVDRAPLGTTTSRTTCWSPRPPAAQRGRPGAVEDDPLAGLRAGRHLDLALAVEGGDRRLAAEHRPGGRDARDGDQVLAVALEPLVGGDGDLDVEVARRARPARRRGRRPRRGSAGRTRSRPGPRPRRCAASRTRPLPSHSSHGVSGILPSPPQASQAAVRITWPKAVRATSRSWPRAPARLAGADRRARARRRCRGSARRSRRRRRRPRAGRR